MTRLFGNMRQVGVVVRDIEAPMAHRAKVCGMGQEGENPRGPFVYFANEGHSGTVIEMAEAMPERMRFVDQVRQAAIGWDGSDPVRRAWPTV